MTEHFDAEGNKTGESKTTTPSRWDEQSRVHELAYTEYLDSLCECGVPRSVCMDKNKAWIVDFKIGYRCRALQKVQYEQSKRDEPYTKNNIPVYAETRKWSVAPYDYEQELADVGEGSPG